ncbi:DMSO reductase iron-sulfur subunit [Slackia heliotrinireducens]|uniref:DMSO reductase, iron-sulfur subunit n=1 Tax=Slackia heliotrinireducens (strain ATCC 29202 / DSM 20476 / NCTC 11029 / RHS 1) TaxID=471855 RepID=C7N223_SLAHD|nr:4Fe-4S dicluster domain-containing protein [Slackia heliotrinireducens]ACV23464.1 DMSO reductase, iron-sulfur subunit [Slackia heliotrinireducens DSM 20476]VEH02794.1 DMSO reductase iron-sulfur subunit [Slackia heliotrinireducens]
MQYGFYFDGTRCTGCKTCVLACKDNKNLTSEQAFRQVYEFEGADGFTADDAGCWTVGSFTYYVSSACNHCATPACVEACPVGTMTKHEDTGLVYNDPETCIGCGSCVNACPYGAPQVDTEIQKSIKCDGCHARVEAGEMPICVAACPQRALEFGDIEELRAKYGDTAAIAPLPDPSQTTPSVCINPPVCFVDWSEADKGTVVNAMELRA